MKNDQELALQHHHDGSNKYSNENSHMHERVEADLGGSSVPWSGVDHTCTHNLTFNKPPKRGVHTPQSNPTQPNSQQHNTFKTHIVNTLQLSKESAELNQQHSKYFN